jgi:response regulator RpfG family c-di-GMP phosphodiesterase
MMGVVAAAQLVDVALAAGVRSSREHAPYGRALVEEFRALAGIGSSIAVTGVLVALAAQVMGLWSLPVFLAPLLLVQFSFRRVADIRSTYSQTIRSLSRVTELGGYTETGHVTRVADLAVAVGTELGMSDAELRDLEYAALLHDIGQLSLPEPIPAGATSWQPSDIQSGIARDGAAVIAQTRVLDEVSTIVAAQAAPYRRPQQPDDPDVPLASRIIRVINAYDDLVADSPEPSRSSHALEQLRLGMIYDYDPRVVATLDRVLGRRRSGH